MVRLQQLSSYAEQQSQRSGQWVYRDDLGSRYRGSSGQTGLALGRGSAVVDGATQIRKKLIFPKHRVYFLPLPTREG